MAHLTTRESPAPVRLAPPADDHDRALLERLWRFHLYDLSERYPSLDPEDDGACRSALAYWLDDATVLPFLLWQDRRASGFALVRPLSNGTRPGPSDRQGRSHVLLELFVMRRCRRRGVGRQALAELFRRFPGPWRLYVMGWNHPALQFCQRVLPELAGGTCRWDQIPTEEGMAFRFTWRTLGAGMGS